jgi:exopolyphosphatase/pppGpp-phosphohydrolase
MPEAERQRVLAAALEVVENQLRDDDPPETRETFDRLVGEGHTEADAKRLIAAVVLAEIGEVLQTNAPFNHSRFVVALDRLPALLDGED